MGKRYAVVEGMRYCYVVDRLEGFRIVDEMETKEAAEKKAEELNKNEDKNPSKQ